MVVDRIGLLARYEGEKPPTDDDIRHQLQAHEERYCVIEAETPEDAIKILYREWEGAQIGDKAPALWINPDKLIQELPPCKRMKKLGRDLEKTSRIPHYLEEGEWICDDGLGPGDVEICIIEDPHDTFDDCEITIFRGRLWEIEQSGDLPSREIGVGDQLFNFLSYKDLVGEPVG